MVEVEVHGISLDLNNQPVLLLREIQGRRVLPIWIGPIEASAITYAARGEAVERPLTLDLIKRIIESLGAKTERVIITQLKDSTFYATLVLSRDGGLISIDARPSDSVAIAVRTKARVFVDSELMDDQGKELTEDEETRLDEMKQRLKGTDPEKFGDFQL